LLTGVIPAKAGIQSGAKRRAVSAQMEEPDSRLRGNDDAWVPRLPLVDQAASVVDAQLLDLAGQACRAAGGTNQTPNTLI
jgi:hypothetical protein